MDPADDLKAFERRTTEIISSLRPSTWRWRLLFVILILTNLITLLNWICDFTFPSFFKPSVTTPVSLSELPTTPLNDLSSSYLFSCISKILRKDIAFFISFSLLIFAFLFGIHRKIFISSIIITRIRSILKDYNMSCDTDGRLILKPRPPAYFHAEF
ncbi:unnamed protein product [Adineta ricciae]|uniref:Transmembrane protein 188 n=1 Tax=Adineta ricciae TaxID=249248 RepID=A0A815MQ75_ADIRI|nr:unnamed protein product [Adineta ricciae]